MKTEDFEYIEAYLTQALPVEEVARFEQRLQSDKEFEAQFRAYRETEQLLAGRLSMDQQEQDFRAALQQRRKFFQGASAPHRQRSRLMLWVSAVAAAAVILLVWSPWQEGLLERYGQQTMTSTVTRGNDAHEAWARIAALFNDGRYEAAVVLMDSARAAGDNSPRLLFYRGVANLHLKKYVKAREDLESVYRGTSIFSSKAAYFTALSFKIEGQNDSCQIWVQKIDPSAAEYPAAMEFSKER